MNITQEFGNASYIIQAYKQDTVIVNQTAYSRSLIITPEFLNAEWAPQGIEELTEQHLEELVTLRPDVVLMGTGQRLLFPDQHVQVFFLQREIGIEFMDTAAACRTYNILMAEGRNVACALLIT